MPSERFRQVVTSEDELRAAVGYPSELAIKKQRPALDERSRALIARSPFDADDRGELPHAALLARRQRAPGGTAGVPVRLWLKARRSASAAFQRGKRIRENPRRPRMSSKVE